ncbi:MAG: class I SAM-dependent rRNA methyltransferase [Spirochaetales bacterium]|nr:class I SAM-dependent rRNA methyltransferase [Spirochaetales bacterium]
MVRLRSGREALIRRLDHPWVYSQAVESASEQARAGELVPLVSAQGAEVLGWGFHSPGSLIAFRFVSRGESRPADSWLEDRLRAALELRERLGIRANAYRLVNSEGDALPGLTVDVYNRTTVVRPLVKGMEMQLEAVMEALQRLLPDNAVYLRRDETAARKEGLTRTTGYLAGSGEGRELIEEGGLRFRVDLAEGQKTGFYLDQRDNRLLARSLCRELRVLNLFAYTGAFALQAAAGGAEEVISVESSATAVELARENARLNPEAGQGSLEWLRGDAFEFLEEPGSYGMVIVDPPPFARRRSELEGAARGYGALNLLAVERVAPGGLLMSFSCSSAVSAELMAGVLQNAVAQAGRRAQVLQRLHAAADHPVLLNHPEGEYLKGWLLRVL